MSKTHIDWSLRPRTPASAATMAALGLAALSVTAGEIAHQSPVWAVAVGVVGIVATVLTGMELSQAALWYRIGCWATASGWLTWTMAAGLDSPIPWGVLGIGALAAALLEPLTHRKPHRVAQPAGAALVPRRHITLADEWIERIHRCSADSVSVSINDVREWPGRTGFSALILLPAGGKTIAHLDALRQGLAADAHLPNGCGVEFTPADHRGAVWMHVGLVNRLAEDIDHPGDYSPRSILDPVTIGEYRDGSPVQLLLREPTTLVVGQKRSGKTVTLHNLTCETGRCVDNLVWHMDMNGGGISQPWLRPWLDGQTSRPAIDWAAPCVEEALLMAQAHLGIALSRKTDYSQLKHDQDVQLLPVSPQVPQVTLVLDEGREILSPQIKDPMIKEVKERVEQVQRIGGNEACAQILSVLRSISSTLDTDVLKQCGNRIIMKVSDQTEIDYLFEYPKGIAKEDLSGQGSGFVRAWPDESTVRAWKAWKMLPRRDIYPAALAIANSRPDLDAPSARAAGRAYASRLQRMRWLFSTPEQRARLTPPEPIELPVTDARGRPIIWDPAQTHPAATVGSGLVPKGAAPAPQPAVHLSLLQGGATAGWGDAAAIAAAARRTPRPIPAEPVTGRLRAEQIRPQDALPQILVRCLAAFDHAGAARLHSEELAAAVGVKDALELAALLRHLGVVALRNPFSRGGQVRRGYQVDDFEAAAARITSGELQVPEEVAAWPAA